MLSSVRFCRVLSVDETVESSSVVFGDPSGDESADSPLP